MRRSARDFYLLEDTVGEIHDPRYKPEKGSLNTYPIGIENISQSYDSF